MNKSKESPILIRIFEVSDIPRIVARFAEHAWPKPAVLFDKYLQEQKSGERQTWVAYLKDDRTHILKMIKSGSAMCWKHINFHGEYDFTKTDKTNYQFDMEEILALEMP